MAPAHHHLAAVASARLHDADADTGLVDPDAVGGPVSAMEATVFEVPAGTVTPASVHRILRRARSAPVEDLLADGTIPSAEVLGTLIPTISATVVAARYADPAAARLVAETYRAFRRRRSLLLVNLESQVRFGELPWVAAAAAHAEAGSVEEAGAVAARVGALAMDHFGATLLPNPLVRELDHLLRLSGHPVALVEELAADIFMGVFSDKFRRAAQAAAPVIAGSVYAAYYDIDPDEIGALNPEKERFAVLQRLKRHDPRITFSDLCRHRAGFALGRPFSVAASGTVIEQAQILTTHNLAQLVAAGSTPTRPWEDLADHAMGVVARLLARALREPRPLATVKDAAYAWRHALFFLSMAGPHATGPFLDRARTLPDATAEPLRSLLGGLAHIAAGGRFVDGQCPDGRQLLGWTSSRHWGLEHRAAARA